MELSTGQQRGLFVVLVILLAAIGIYLLGPGRSHGAGAAPAASVSPAASAATSAPQVVPTQDLAPTPIAVPTAIKSANIYSWLPFTQQDLNAAANVTVAFAAADQTFSRTDKATTYAQRLQKLVTPPFLGTLEAQFRPPGATGMTAKSSGVINQILSFGSSPQSITFRITFTEQTTTGGTTSTQTTQNDVTVVAVAGGWQVNNIQLDGQGNQ
jgi:hypothetical protein